MDILFSAIFDGTNTPFGPSSFLHATWMSQSHLAGYQQQDAHEFFISVISTLHENGKSIIKRLVTYV
jgi:ubiquitin carboxyl-terminal hydrolase 22/27/51